MVKPNLSSKEEEVKSLEEDKDKFRKELEEEIEYLLNEKNQMQSRHMVSSFMARFSTDLEFRKFYRGASKPYLGLGSSKPDPNWSRSVYQWTILIGQSYIGCRFY